MKLPLSLVLGTAVLSGCAMLSPNAPIAVAELSPTQGNKVSGTTTFVQQGNKVLIDARIKGLTRGLHGFHIHEKGDCSSGDGMSAGGHFNPGNMEHGDPSAMKHHGGDLGNLTADASGNAVLNTSIVMHGIGFARSGVNSINGRGLIIHADPDDFTTQPTGNSGKRVACGIINLQ